MLITKIIKEIFFGMNLCSFTTDKIVLEKITVLLLIGITQTTTLQIQTISLKTNSVHNKRKRQME
jgi:ABC-type uncharacterized transport system permease subunit